MAKRKFSHDLRCELCGKRFQNLATHLAMIHCMDGKGYRKQFGVSHLMSDALRKKMANIFARLPKTRSSKYVPYDREGMLQILKLLASVEPNLTPTDVKDLRPRFYNQLRTVFGKASNAFLEAGLDAKQNVKWDEQLIIQAIKRRKRRRQSLSSSDVLHGEGNLWNAACSFFGSWEAAIESAGFDYQAILKSPQPIERAELDRQLRGWAKKNGPLVASEIFRADPTLYRRMLRAYGKIETAAKTLRLPFRKLAEPWDRQKVLAEALARKRKGLSLNTKIVCDEYNALYFNGIKLFGTWSQVLKELGIDPATQGSFKRLTTEDLIAEIRSWSARHGALNHSMLMRTDRLLARRISNRFGSLQEGARVCGVPFEKHASKKAERTKWTHQRVLAEIASLKSLEAASSKHPALYGAAVRLFGSWQAALDAGH